MRPTIGSLAAARCRFYNRASVAAAGCLLAVALLAGCVTPPARVPQAAAGPGEPAFYGEAAGGSSDGPVIAASSPAVIRSTYRTTEEILKPYTREEKAVIASAEALLGSPPGSKVVINGRTFVLDCIGTVSAIFYRLDIDVQKDFSRYGGNGVSRLYSSLKARNALHHDPCPRPGDVIIWDNTWDANEDGNKTNDRRTHAGVVMSVDADGTIRYVHEHIRRGVIEEVMNLLAPRDYYGAGGKVINNSLALGSGVSKANNPPRWTSGDLLNSFGDLLREKEYFRVRLGEGIEAISPAVALEAAPDARLPE